MKQITNQICKYCLIKIRVAFTLDFAGICFQLFQDQPQQLAYLLESMKMILKPEIFEKNIGLVIV